MLNEAGWPMARCREQQSSIVKDAALGPPVPAVLAERTPRRATAVRIFRIFMNLT